MARVAGIVLAAGASRRMGRFKLLLPWRGRPVLDHVLRAVRASALDSRILVLGHEAAAIRRALDLADFAVLENPEYPAGQSTSMGVGLLAVAFVRLALNPAVLTYHPRSATPILNWYLYAYGIVTACLFAGGRLLASPRDRLLSIKIPPILNGLGTALAFLLLNIEIADYFSETGSVLTFQFSGNLGRDMTYSLAWAAFAPGIDTVAKLNSLLAGVSKTLLLK